MYMMKSVVYMMMSVVSKLAEKLETDMLVLFTDHDSQLSIGFGGFWTLLWNNSGKVTVENQDH